MLTRIGCLGLTCVASAQVTVYNNDDFDGFGYNWGLGWTVAGEDVEDLE